MHSVLIFSLRLTKRKNRNRLLTHFYVNLRQILPCDHVIHVTSRLFRWFNLIVSHTNSLFSNLPSVSSPSSANGDSGDTGSAFGGRTFAKWPALVYLKTWNKENKNSCIFACNRLQINYFIVKIKFLNRNCLFNMFNQLSRGIFCQKTITFLNNA